MFDPRRQNPIVLLMKWLAAAGVIAAMVYLNWLPVKFRDGFWQMPASYRAYPDCPGPR